jgi:hypothetical protein
LDLDHVFVFVEPGGGAARSRLEASGLRPTYERRHEGQGTANVCYAFDNAYLELLWVDDAPRLAGPAFRRTGLWPRAEWRTTGACPFGICVRSEPAFPFPGWLWSPPYLPPGLYVEVAQASADPDVPFLFRFPGATRPDTWPEARAKGCQRAAGLAAITGLHLAALPGAEDLPGLVLEPGLGPQRALLDLSRTDGGPARRLALPACEFLA